MQPPPVRWVTSPPTVNTILRKRVSGCRGRLPLTSYQFVHYLYFVYYYVYNYRPRLWSLDQNGSGSFLLVVAWPVPMCAGYCVSKCILYNEETPYLRCNREYVPLSEYRISAVHQWSTNETKPWPWLWPWLWRASAQILAMDVDSGYEHY